jgi:hypothetical protein
MKIRILLIVIVFILSACDTPEVVQDNSRHVTAIKTFSYSNGTVCKEREIPSPYKREIGCFCEPYNSRTQESYRIGSNLPPGYTSQCKDPDVFDREENQERIQKANEERIRKEKEAQDRIKSQQEQAALEKYKASPEGKKFINSCHQEKKKHKEAEYSCAAAYDKNSCVRTRYEYTPQITYCAVVGVKFGPFE